jgi:ABC-type transport system involved in multi-copper enzyme maturation permease subunit
MSLWRDAATVVAGATATVVLSGVTALVLLLLFVGVPAVSTAASQLSDWVLVLPLALCAVGGGATTGSLQRDSPTKCATLGCVAASLGVLFVSAVVGLLALVVVLGMTPAGGREPDLAQAVLTVEGLSVGITLVIGPAFGAAGGLGGYLARRHFGSES